MEPTELQESFDALERRQHAVLDASREWAENFARAVADAAPDTDVVVRWIDAAFDLTQTLVDNQREFVKAVATAVLVPEPRVVKKAKRTPPASKRGRSSTGTRKPHVAAA
jgi:hypothetical protein